ncbi:MAG: hypothetical protein NTZ78_07015 [Candidatus Aureabacteria bacterium]|nr:hypothetical protein [Candidatus Auribacterota bacterium]
MKKLITAALSLVCMVGLGGFAVAGSLGSPGYPSAGSGMYTLQNLYDYLTSGTALTVQTGFQEPTLAPGSTMKTTKEIGDAIKEMLDQGTVTADEVKAGERFFCTQPGNWGIRTGTAQLVPTPTPTPTITPTLTPTSTMTPTPWGSDACAARGGMWRGTQLASPDDQGCWFYASVGGQSCDTLCSTNGLRCLSKNWNDDSSCTLCKEIIGDSPSCYSSCGSTKCPAYYAGGNECQHRSTGAVQDCSSNAGGSSLEHRLCVCIP